MRYILYGNDEQMISFQLDRLRRKEASWKEFEYIKEDKEKKKETNEDLIVEAISEIPLFDPERTVVIRNCSLAKAYGRGMSPADLDIDDPDLDLILVFRTKPKGNSEEAVRLINESVMIDCSPLTDRTIHGFYDDLFRKYGLQPDRNGKQWMIDHLGRNPVHIDGEMEKLAILSSRPSLEEIESICSEPLDQQIFLISDALNQKDAPAFIRYYRHFRTMSMQPTAIVSFLGKQVRFLFQVFLLQGRRDEDIAEQLGQKRGRVWYARKSLRRYSLDQLMDTLSLLSELDLKIKKGLISGDEEIEAFFLQKLFQKSLPYH